ncbi:MAG: hypothetical protein HUU14_00825 [Dehalococcoidia bacterium]|nr:hypothetical protein [Chloroflexi bacterium CFX7]MCK6564289.1 hypothetical protein [Dehalococcoidia bacterium]NUQ54413.1 hypothetical protein [Dehalococcoidia bacterium]
MNTHVTPTPALPGAAGHLGRRTLFAALGGAVVLVAAFAAVVFARGGSEESPPVAAPAAAALAVEAKSASLGDIVVSPAPAARTIYVVSSEEQAASVSEGLAESNAILGALGEPPQLASVLVFSSLIEDGALFQSLIEDNAILRALGLPEDVIVDLRQ